MIFDEVDVLDFCGPFEVFSVARPAGENPYTTPLFEAVVIAEEDRIFSCRGGILVKPRATIEDHSHLDVLVVPGGRGARRELTNERLLDWIEAQYRHGVDRQRMHRRLASRRAGPPER